MFDTHNHHEAAPYAKTVTVTEHKAPTDESIRLYEEIKTKAYKSIVDTIDLKDNNIECSAVLFRDFSCFEIYLQYKLNLNGRVHEGSIPIKCFENYSATDKLAVVRALIQRVSEHLTEHIFMSLDSFAQQDLMKISERK